MAFIDLFNFIAQAESKGKATLATSPEDKIIELGLDSMDLMVVGMYLCCWYGVPDNTAKKMQPVLVPSKSLAEGEDDYQVSTIKELEEFLIKFGTRPAPTLEEAKKDYVS